MEEKDGGRFDPVDCDGARKRVVVWVVVLVILAVVAVKYAVMSGADPTPGTATSGTPVSGAVASSGALTSEHNDAVADYEAALNTGKPVYVLFHSLTCQPCREISNVAEKVVPGYEGRVVFVNAITDDGPGRALASKFSFQYIPTSFFVKADGTVIDSYTGVLSDAEMRARLDKLEAE